eukprot:CAMPEP_0201545566 /NCGR_PEP_ID=MMETSP0173_2-20130828/2041_1 /ASSEMBLY_ACC=CAM_ASM_000268 /TAXON_ID=218659 /ORGANISM="Vexillifera sp., Strain DIVA3 564/2" /LENGTH=416 /DNA_ID=CAMNT_0047953989 /DNA_START=53 /DNA_END=1303 /DNA_ORIENTATION=-
MSATSSATSSNTSKIDLISETILKRKEKALRSLSLKVHAKPELAMKEHYAVEQCTAYLKSEGFQVTTPYCGVETAFLAEFTNGSGGPVFGVCCEYDALPEIGHACGHNLICISAIATGVAMKAYLEENPDRKATIRVIGTPAEEAVGGKLILIEKGAFQDIDISMMVHPSNYNASFVKTLAVSEVTVEYRGVNAHAAGMPWDGKNALDAVVAAYNNISLARQQLKPKDRIHAIITNGGAKPNIIPDYASLYAYCRAEDVAELKRVKAVFTRCAQAAAVATDTQAELNWGVQNYANVISNSVLATLWAKFWREHNMPLGTIAQQESQPIGSTDYGNVSYETPGIHPIYDIFPHEAKVKPGNHTRGFTAQSASDLGFERTWIASICMAKTMKELIENPTLIEQAKVQFQKDLNQIQQK